MNEAEHWQDLIRVEQLERGDVTPAEFRGLPVAVYDTDEGLFASTARCSHAGANLCDGYFDGKHIECPLHQGLFDARTGEAKAAPATRPLTMYPIRVRDGMVQIRHDQFDLGSDRSALTKA